MSTETLGWVLAVGPLVLVWLVLFFVDPYAALLVVGASLAAGLMAGCIAYGLMLTGVFS